jgi:hypothetical protein
MRLLSFAESATLLVRRSPARRVMYAEWLPSDLVEALWQEPTALLTRSEVLQQRGVRQTVRLDWGPRSFVLKRYVEPSWRHAAKQLVMPSRASITWRISHHLADGGILTPRPVACIENRWGALGLDSYLMYPYVKGETVSNYLLRQHDPEEQAARLVGQCEELWQRLAVLGASLGDANTGNFIVTSTNDLWVIDLDKARRFRSGFLAERQRRRTWRQLMLSMQRTLNKASRAPEQLPFKAAA